MLSKKQLQAIDLAAHGKVWSEVATEIKVNRKTIQRWRTENDEFLSEYKKAVNEYLNECTAIAKQSIGALTPAAVMCLRKAMEHSNGPGVKAALSILQGADILKPEETSNETIVVEFGELVPDPIVPPVAPPIIDPKGGK